MNTIKINRLAIKFLIKIHRAGADLFPGNKADNEEVKGKIYGLISCSTATLSR